MSTIQGEMTAPSAPIGWHRALNELELLEAADKLATKHHGQTSNADDPVAQRLLDAVLDAKQEAEDALLHIPAPDIEGFARKVAIIKAREIDCPLVISVIGDDGIRLART